MPSITFINLDGSTVEIDHTDGLSVMEIAMDNYIEGIEAQCGGSCACGTCHCYVEQGLEQLPKAGDFESAMLENVAAERRQNSRLACQLKPQNDLVVRLPEYQS